MDISDAQRGMSWPEALALAEEIRATPWCRVYALVDQAFRPDNWRIAVSYHPRRVSGSRYARFVHSREDWQRFQSQAVAANTRRIKTPE